MMHSLRFQDREDAGRRVAARLGKYAGRSDVLVLALPRGGVPIGYEVARALGVPLDLMIVRKLGVPGHEELAMGAIASGGVRVVNEDVVRALRIRPETLDRVAAEEKVELERREQRYRGDRPHPSIEGRTVILVDDGIATGATMRAAIRALRAQNPKRVVVAVPTAAAPTCAELAPEVDELVCVSMPDPFGAIGVHYYSFPQLNDAEVGEILRRETVGPNVSPPRPDTRNAPE